MMFKPGDLVRLQLDDFFDTKMGLFAQCLAKMIYLKGKYKKNYEHTEFLMAHIHWIGTISNEPWIPMLAKDRTLEDLMPDGVFEQFLNPVKTLSNQTPRGGYKRHELNEVFNDRFRQIETEYTLAENENGETYGFYDFTPETKDMLSAFSARVVDISTGPFPLFPSDQLITEDMVSKKDGSSLHEQFVKNSIINSKQAIELEFDGSLIPNGWYFSEFFTEIKT